MILTNNDQLRILIQASLDEIKSTKAIQEQLKSIQSKLNINIGIDSGQISDIANQIKQLQQKVNIGSRNVTIIDFADVKNGTTKVFKDVEAIKKKFGSIGELKFNSVLDPINKDLQQMQVEIRKADGLIEKLNFKAVRIQDGNKFSDQLELTGMKEIDNTAQIYEKQLQQVQVTQAKISQQQRKNYEDWWQQATKQQDIEVQTREKVIAEEQKIRVAIEKREQAEREVKAQIKEQLELYQRIKQAETTRSKNRLGDRIDNNALDNQLNNVLSVDPSTFSNLSEYNKWQKQMNVGFTEISANAKTAQTRVLGFGEQLSIAMSRFPIWMIASTAFFQSINILTSFYDTLTLIDKQLISIQKVTNETDLSGMFENATDSAYKFGQTIDTVLSTIEAISKLGFGTEDAQKLTDNSLMLATVGEFKNASDAAEYLVAIMRQYKMEIADTSKVVDSLNELSNKTGSTTAQLAQALSKSSSSAQVAGMSFDELAGIGSQLIETLKISGNEAGTFLKTLNTRILRETTQKDLESFGVQIKDTTGEMLSSTEILKNVAERWDTYSKSQKNAIGEDLGGAWHVNKVIATIEGMDRALQNAETSANSFGSATAELTTFEQGLEFKTNVLKASLQELAMTAAGAGGRDGLVILIEGTTALIQGFNELTQSTNGWNIKLPLIAAGVYGLAKAFQILSTSIVGVRASLGWISLAVVGVETLVSSFIGLNKATQVNTEELQKNAQETYYKSNQLKDLIARHDELIKKTSISTDEQAELHTILSEINTISPHLVKSTGEYGDALKLNKKKADEYVESLKKMSEEQVRYAKLENEKELIDAEKELAEASKAVEKFDNDFTNKMDFKDKFEKSFGVDGIREATIAFENEMNKLIQKQNEFYESGDSEGFSDVEVAITKLRDDFYRYKQIIEDTDGSLKDFNKSESEFQKAQDNVNKLKERQTQLEKFGEGIDNLADSSKSLSDANLDLEGSFDGMGNSLDEVDELAKKFDNATDSISTLNGFLTELNDNHELSADSLSSIISEYPDLLAYMNDEASLVDVIKDKIAEEEQVAKQAIYNKIKDNESYFNVILEGNKTYFDELGKMYGVDLGNAKSLAEAKMQVEQGLIKTLAGTWAKYYKQQADGTVALKDQAVRAMMYGGVSSEEQQKVVSLQNNLNSKLADLSSSFQGIALGNVSVDFKNIGIDEKKDKKSKEDRQIDQYLTDQYAQSIDNLNLKLVKSEERTRLLSTTSEDYRKELQTQIDLHKQQQVLTENEIARLESSKSALQSKLSSMKSFNSLSTEQKEKYNELSKQIDDHAKTIVSLKGTYIDLNSTISALAFERVQSVLKGNAEAIDDIDYKLERSRKIMSLYNEGSNEYREQLEEQNRLLQIKAERILKDREELKELTKQTGLTVEQQKELNEELENSSLAFQDVQQQIDSNIESQRNYRKSLADEIVNTMKEAYEKQKELATKAIDDELEALENAHQDKMDMYDEDISKYEEIVNRKLRLIDDQADQDSFNKDLTKLQQERQALQSRINNLSLDDSVEAQAKRVELEKQLAELTETIEEKKTGRTRDLRKRNLQDELNSFKKSVDEQRKTDEEKYKSEKERLEDVRKETEYKFNEMINNERKFATIREQILAGNLDNVKLQMQGFLDDFEGMNEDTVKGIESSWQGLLNVIDSVKAAQTDLGGIPANNSSSPDNSLEVGDNSVGTRGRLRSGTFADSSSAHSLATKLKADYNALDARVESTNGGYKVVGDFFSYDRAEKVLERLKQLGFLKVGHLEKYHTGGIVGGTGSKLASLIDNLANKFSIKPNEQLVKALKGEVMIPQSNIPNLIRNFQSALSPSVATSGGDTYALTLHIDNLNGTKQEADNLASTILKNIKIMKK